MILQGKLPDVASEGFLTLDSLVVDISKVFEAYIRRVLLDHANSLGWQIVDGNEVFYPFFADGNDFRVKPDVVIVAEGTPAAILDVKYKPDPKESDRYEILAFMDALGIQRGGFVCPQKADSSSRYMGVTAGGKVLSTLRFDLAAADLEAECTRFVQNVGVLIAAGSEYG